MLVFSVKRQLAVRAHGIAAESTDKTALRNGHGQPGIRQRRNPQQFVWCKLKALTQLLKDNDRCVGLSSGNTAEVSWAEATKLCGFFVTEIAAAAQLKNGSG